MSGHVFLAHHDHSGGSCQQVAADDIGLPPLPNYYSYQRAAASPFHASFPPGPPGVHAPPHQTTTLNLRPALLTDREIPPQPKLEQVSGLYFAGFVDPCFLRTSALETALLFQLVYVIVSIHAHHGPISNVQLRRRTTVVSHTVTRTHDRHDHMQLYGV